MITADIGDVDVDAGTGDIEIGFRITVPAGLDVTVQADNGDRLDQWLLPWERTTSQIPVTVPAELTELRR